MKEDKVLQGKLNLIEKELITLTDKLDDLSASLRELDEIRAEIRAIKVFLSRSTPDFKAEFQDIIKKVSSP